ncbi:xylose isomerase-like protein [Vararia minispora EC-137]|uniref:Xylose isomerase-like protein n=1 Tax=Vararia minispora EC-137 TaxID=1314806 RepID=A0ACB8QV59_9AGAM|nr:xylose isomerase-like protein [Vararia minispora EC-137]
MPVASNDLLKTIPTCFATCSIGYDDSRHSLPAKLEAISSAGFSAIELSFPDLLSFARWYLNRDVPDTDYDALCVTGTKVAELCAQKGLQILMLQPFGKFEGWSKKSAERENAFKRARGWIRIMKAVGTDMLQVRTRSSDAEHLDACRIVSDLQESADILAPLTFDVWNIVCAFDRSNIGLCLDTFQTTGSEFVDPGSGSGFVEGSFLQEFQHSLDELARTVPEDKIYLLQVSDAYKLRIPLETDASGQKPRAQWSTTFRPVPFEGYLPVVDVTVAVLKTGFRGWFSMEVFDSGWDGKGKE